MFSGLSHSERHNLKYLFKRKVAGKVSLDDRKTIREIQRYILDNFDIKSESIRALPVSTLEWSSTTYSFGEKRIALIDVEQANAILFFIAKKIMMEMPIFPYIEFMIRSSEAYLSNGNIGLSLLVAKKANSKLLSYAKYHKSLPYIPRPQFHHEDLHSSIMAGLVLPFVAAHELGHLIGRADVPKLSVRDWIYRRYHEIRYEPGRHVEARFDRFIKPESVQKFTDKGLPCGDIILGIKLATKFPHIVEHHITEAYSDFWGLVGLTKYASGHNVEPRLALHYLHMILECSEMLMSLKRLLPRLPVVGRRSNVTHEPSTLTARMIMLVEVIAAIRNGDINVPVEIREYWLGLSCADMTKWLDYKDSGRLQSAANGLVHMSRAALVLSSLGRIPAAPTAQQIIDQHGPLAGDFFFLHSYKLLPETFFKVSHYNTWNPDDGEVPADIGFASAMYDVAKIVREGRNLKKADFQFRAKGGIPKHLILDVIRHPRLQAFNRKIIDWPHPIMNHIG